MDTICNCCATRKKESKYIKVIRICEICSYKIKDKHKKPIGKCGHYYHYNCLNEWLKFNKQRCPGCAVYGCQPN